MTNPPNDRSPMAVASLWASRVISVSLEMVLPGLAGLWLDKKLCTVPLFTLLEESEETSIALEHITPPLANPEGLALFQDTCAFCHGRRGEGGHNGMPLEGLAAFGTGYVADIISSGQNNMPSFSDTI